MLSWTRCFHRRRRASSSPSCSTRDSAPHKVSLVFIHGSDRPDTFIDIADVLDVKLAALKQHKSQMGEWDPTEMITGWARLQGARRKLKAAESYRLMRLHED